MNIVLPPDFRLEICPHARPDDAFLLRLIEFYHRQPRPNVSHIWTGVFEAFEAHLIEALSRRDVNRVGDLLCSMYGGTLVWGMDDWNGRTDSPDTWEVMLKRLCRAVGLTNREWQLGEALEALGWHFGFELFRPGGGGMMGYLKGELCLPRKHLEALITLSSIERLSVWPPDRVLEIGGGLGFLAAAIRMAGPGATYESLDLPVVSVMQAYLLSFVIHPDNIWLKGEERTDQVVYIHGPELEGEPEFSLIINQDSLPEMPIEVQDSYIDLVSMRLSRGGIFFSVNQEGESACCIRSVNAAMKWTNGLSLLSRDPSWSREGYVKEVWSRGR